MPKRYHTKTIPSRNLTPSRNGLVFFMSKTSVAVNLRSWAGSARSLLDSTCALAEVHIHDLKSQIDDLWEAAEELIPRTVPADLIAHVEKTLDELRGWKAIGLREGFST
jgi:hypothetical protein